MNHTITNRIDFITKLLNATRLARHVFFNCARSPLTDRRKGNCNEASTLDDCSCRCILKLLAPTRIFCAKWCKWQAARLMHKVVRIESAACVFIWFVFKYSWTPKTVVPACHPVSSRNYTGNLADWPLNDKLSSRERQAINNYYILIKHVHCMRSDFLHCSFLRNSPTCYTLWFSLPFFFSRSMYKYYQMSHCVRIDWVKLKCIFI